MALTTSSTKAMLLPLGLQSGSVWHRESASTGVRPLPSTFMVMSAPQEPLVYTIFMPSGENEGEASRPGAARGVRPVPSGRISAMSSSAEGSTKAIQSYPGFHAGSYP